MKKRSKYKPKPVNAQAHLLAMLGACRMSVANVLLRANPVSLAVDDVARGSASIESWRDIFDAVNVTEELIRARVAAGSVEPVQAVMLAILNRERSTGVRAARHDELAELRAFAGDYATILSGVTNQEFDRALVAVRDRVRRVMSAKSIPENIVVVEAV